MPAAEVHDEFKECSRIVPQHKNEDIDSKKYWHNLFQKLDHDLKIPDYRRLAVLRQVFHHDLLKHIVKILEIHGDKEVGKDDHHKHESISATMPVKSKLLRLREEVGDESLISLRSTHDSDLELQLEPHRRIDFRRMLTANTESSAFHDTTNMYMHFLNLPENVAQRWRPKPPLTFTGMNLNEKCEALTVAIAADFVEWLKGLGGDEKTTLDVPAILNLFEIGFNAHAADSLCVRIKELNAVTKSIANARHMPQASYTAHLYKQLYRDMNSVKKQEDMFAFGTALPPEMRQAPQKDNIAQKWLQNKRVPERIANMAVVWEGIETLKSTNGYCKFLREHPEIDPPKYLRSYGLLSRKISMDEPRTSTISQMSDPI